jgi:hypothetical protein
MNCHPAGDVPLQGDDSHLHTQDVKRGPDGKGKYALKCANCHQLANLPGENMPPGNPNWHLPPPEMPMVFQGRTPGALARQLKDPKRNGGKTLDELFHHVSEDKLVLGGWDPGDGRTKPPLTHADFVSKMRARGSRRAPPPPSDVSSTRPERPGHHRRAPLGKLKGSWVRASSPRPPEMRRSFCFRQKFGFTSLRR